MAQRGAAPRGEAKCFTGVAVRASGTRSESPLEALLPPRLEHADSA